MNTTKKLTKEQLEVVLGAASDAYTFARALAYNADRAARAAYLDDSESDHAIYQAAREAYYAYQAARASACAAYEEGALK